MNFRTFHILNKDGKKVSRAVCAFTVNEDQVTVGFSICSPLDQFNKTKGRLCASGRMEHPRTQIIVEKQSSLKDTLRDALLAHARRKKTLWLEDIIMGTPTIQESRIV